MAVKTFPPVLQKPYEVWDIPHVQMDHPDLNPYSEDIYLAGSAK